jgi:thymidylate synthase (FAD)
VKITKQSVELLQISENPEKLIELAGRTCYKSHDKITKDSAKKFVKMIKSKSHNSVLEHAFATFRIITDRAISHEIIRHRLASYSQESTRYCAYKGGIEVIVPHGFKEDSTEYLIWEDLMFKLEAIYCELLKRKVPPENARDILPNCLKTELIMTANFREWLHFIKLRSLKSAHPKIRYIAESIREILHRYADSIF